MSVKNRHFSREINTTLYQQSRMHLMIRCSVGVFENDDDSIAPEEHFRDKSVLGDWLRLFLAFATFGCLHPDFFHILQNQVAMSVECLHTGQEFFVIATVDEDLGVVFHTLGEN